MHNINYTHSPRYTSSPLENIAKVVFGLVIIVAYVVLLWVGVAS